MQIATLNYQFNPKEDVNGNGRAKLRHRQVLTTTTNPQKKSKPRQTLNSDFSLPSNGQLPPITRYDQRRDSRRTKGSSLTSSKLRETSAYSFAHQSRSHSRQSNKSDQDSRRRSMVPVEILKPASKLIRAKFAHPIKIRSAEFYGPDKSETELNLRENSFVNDSIRSAHQNRRLSIIPPYEPLDDPHLRQFFQSPIVLNIVRKTINIDPNNSYKQDERSSRNSKIKTRSRSNDLYDIRNDGYLRIVHKRSSGYAKLNGYDCIPSYSPARHYHIRSSIIDPISSRSHRWNTMDSHLNHSTTNDKYQSSANTSLTSVPIQSNNQLQKQQQKKKSRQYEKKSEQPKPNAISSPLRDPLRHLVEATTSNIEPSSMTETNGNGFEQKNE